MQSVGSSGSQLRHVEFEMADIQVSILSREGVGRCTGRWEVCLEIMEVVRTRVITLEAISIWVEFKTTRLDDIT